MALERPLPSESCFRVDVVPFSESMVLMGKNLQWGRKQVKTSLVKKMQNAKSPPVLYKGYKDVRPYGHKDESALSPLDQCGKLREYKNIKGNVRWVWRPKSPKVWQECRM